MDIWGFDNGTGPFGPVFSWITDLARPMPVVDGLLSGVVVHRVRGRYLPCPAAGDSMERLLVDAGHVLRGGQDGSRKEQDCKKRECEARGHRGLHNKRGPCRAPTTLSLDHRVFALVLIVVRFKAEIAFFDDLCARRGFKRERQLTFIAGENVLPRVLGHSLKLDALV